MSNMGHNRKLCTTNERKLIRSPYLLLPLLESPFDNGVEVVLGDLGEQVLDRIFGLCIDSYLIFRLVTSVAVIPSSFLSHLAERIGVIIGYFTLRRQSNPVLLTDLGDDDSREMEANTMDLFRKIVDLCMRRSLD